VSNQESARNLLDKVLLNAREEAASLMAGAEAWDKQKSGQIDRQIETETAETEKRISEEKNKIVKRIRSSLVVEKRRIRQQLREKLLSELETECYRYLEKEIGTPFWRDTLLLWIVEGAVAIDRDEGCVNASAGEKKQIDRSLLDGAERKYQELTGRHIRLALSAREPLFAQGVVVESSDGRLSYSNELKTRYHRRQSRIREMLNNDLIEPFLNEQGDSHE
jgi:vacuolar-type H+-ATPase subunit E/Vma4